MKEKTFPRTAFRKERERLAAEQRERERNAVRTAAIDENGVVTNVLIADPSFSLPGQRLVFLKEDDSVHIGDTYSDGIFTSRRDPEEG